jgi:hypothetical protein
VRIRLLWTGACFNEMWVELRKWHKKSLRSILIDCQKTLFALPQPKDLEQYSVFLFKKENHRHSLPDIFDWPVEIRLIFVYCIWQLCDWISLKLKQDRQTNQVKSKPNRQKLDVRCDGDRQSSPWPRRDGAERQRRKRRKLIQNWMENGEDDRSEFVVVKNRSYRPCF